MVTGPEVTEPPEGYRFLGATEADDRRRLALGRAGVQPGDQFAVYRNDGGQLLLIPQVTIPRAEYERLKLAAVTESRDSGCNDWVRVK